jgi:hypothetical protein
MLAVSAYADGKGDCPLELAEALWSERYRLAGPGSLEDQDAVQLIRYDQLQAVYGACRHFKQSGLKALSVDERKIVLEIADLELANA